MKMKLLDPNNQKGFVIDLMRLFVFLFCTTVFSFSSTGLLSQNTKITIEENQVVSVDEVFKMIKSQTRYSFVYQEDMFNDFPMVFFKKGKIKVSDLLEKSFPNERVTFNFLDRHTIAITLKENVPVQDMTITGRVTDKDGIPIPGINVMITNRSIQNQKKVKDYFIRGTSTDFKGDFSLQGKVGNYLIIYGLGYEFSSQQIVVGKQEYNVTLNDRAAELDEIVLVGYGLQRREEISSAVSSVKSEDIVKTGVGAVSFDKSLPGLLKGVNVVSNTGSTTGNVDINIRGYTSPFSGSDNNPLFVIDGVPFQVNPNTTRNDETRFTEPLNPLLALNPNEIESIDVLKDAAATAIYGSRGANGVIIVNTKKGERRAKPTVSFSSTVTLSKPIALDNYLSTADWRIYLDTYFKNTSQAISDGFITNPSALSEFRDLVNLDANFLYTGLNEANIGSVNTNWADVVYRSAAYTNTYNFSIRGGTQATAYSMNLGYIDKEGLVHNDNLKQYNLRLALDSKISKIFQVGTNLNLSYSKRILGTFSGEYTGSGYLDDRPDRPAFDENGEHILRHETDWFGIVPAIGPTPYANATANSNNTNAYNILGNVYAKVDLNKNLNVKADLNGGLFITDQYQYKPATIINSFIPSSQPAPDADRSFAYDTQAINSNLTTDLTVNYNNSFGNHNVGATIGYSWLRESADRSFHFLQGFPDDQILTNPSNAITSDASASVIESGLNSLLGRLTYNYDSRYFVTLSARQDKSSKFPEGNKKGLFPSASVSWNMANEKFFNALKAVNLLRLRVSAGITGSTNIRDFSFLQGFVPGSRTEGTYNGQSAIGLGNELANNNVKWEETSEVNIGLDFGVFNNRLRGSVDIYNKRTDGALVTTPIPLETGLRNFTSNFIDLTNKGFEIELGGDLISTKNFNWYASINVSQNKNTVDNVTSIMAENPRSRYLVGKPINVIRGFVVEGIFQTQEEVDALNSASPTGNYMDAKYGFAGPGDYKYTDINNDNIITLDDSYAILGNAQPDFFGGFISKMTYKGFELAAFFNFVKGGEVMYAEGPELNPLPRFNIVDRFAHDRWSPTNTDARWPRLVERGFNDLNDQFNSALVFDRSYVRLNNIQLTYNLPVEAISILGLTRTSLFVSGSNLKTWTKEYPGKDPGILGAQQDRFGQAAYPNAKSWNFGINLNF